MDIIHHTKIFDILLIKPSVLEDSRGEFFESFSSKKLSEAIGHSIEFIQDNYSISHNNVLRGLHYQLKTPQAKLISVIKGEIFDVAVDLRQNSKTFKQSVGQKLSEENRLQMYIPEGFAHGFLTLSQASEVLYKVNAPYRPDDEKTIIWNDDTLNIQWPISESPVLSNRDKVASKLQLFDCY